MLDGSESVSYYDLPVRALSESCRRVLSDALNSTTVKTTEEEVPRDYRGLAKLMAFAPEVLDQLGNMINPTEELLKLWGTNPTNSVGKLVDLLNAITRFDVVDDVLLVLERHVPTSYRNHEQRSRQLHIATREEWGGTPLSQTNQQKLILPTYLAIIHHTKFAAYGRAMPQVLQEIRERSIASTGDPEQLEYNFVVSTDGTVYEGTGWSIASFHHSRFDFQSVQVAVVGDYDKEMPDDRMMEGLQQLLQRGVAEGKLTRSFRLCGFCDVDLDSSPGSNVMDVIRHWPNYRSTKNVLNTPAEYHELKFGF